MKETDFSSPLLFIYALETAAYLLYVVDVYRYSRVNHRWCFYSNKLFRNCRINLKLMVSRKASKSFSPFPSLFYLSVWENSIHGQAHSLHTAIIIFNVSSPSSFLFFSFFIKIRYKVQKHFTVSLKISLFNQLLFSYNRMCVTFKKKEKGRLLCDLLAWSIDSCQDRAIID